VQRCLSIPEEKLGTSTGEETKTPNSKKENKGKKIKENGREEIK